MCHKIIFKIKSVTNNWAGPLIHPETSSMASQGGWGQPWPSFTLWTEWTLLAYCLHTPIAQWLCKIHGTRKESNLLISGWFYYEAWLTRQFSSRFPESQQDSAGGPCHPCSHVSAFQRQRDISLICKRQTDFHFSAVLRVVSHVVLFFQWRLNYMEVYPCLLTGKYKCCFWGFVLTHTQTHNVYTIFWIHLFLNLPPFPFHICIFQNLLLCSLLYFNLARHFFQCLVPYPCLY